MLKAGVCKATQLLGVISLHALFISLLILALWSFTSRLTDYQA